MKAIYIIHGWKGGPNSELWFSWLRDECLKMGMDVVIPKMPNTNYPKITEWVNKLKEIITPTEETCLVGHSMGAQAILRYLEQCPANIKIKGCVFVAGFFNLLDGAYENQKENMIAKPWIETAIDLERVKLHTNNFLAVFSRDDPCVPLSDARLFREGLGAKVVIKEHAGHFNEIKKILEVMRFIENENY